jgi:hypothetical protein
MAGMLGHVYGVPMGGVAYCENEIYHGRARRGVAGLIKYAGAIGESVADGGIETSDYRF